MIEETKRIKKQNIMWNHNVYLMSHNALLMAFSFFFFISLIHLISNLDTLEDVDDDFMNVQSFILKRLMIDLERIRFESKKRVT